MKDLHPNKICLRPGQPDNVLVPGATVCGTPQAVLFRKRTHGLGYGTMSSGSRRLFAGDSEDDGDVERHLLGAGNVQAVGFLFPLQRRVAAEQRDGLDRRFQVRAVG